MFTRSTHPQAVRAAAEFENKLFAVQGNKITAADDAEYINNRTHINVVCQVCSHEWAPRPDSLLEGKGCPKCKASQDSERRRDKSRALVGTTNVDGVKALEIKFEWKNNKSKKAGGNETARLRCCCPHCDNDQWWVHADHFQQPGNSTHCGCQKSKRESINTHLNKKGWGDKPAMLYISPVYFDLFTKIGITNDFTRRSTTHEVTYEGAYFVSHLYKRSWVYVAEQILLKETMAWQPTEPLPKEMIETYWPGTSELRDWRIDPDQLRSRFLEIIKDIETDGDWYRVYRASFAPAD